MRRYYNICITISALADYQSPYDAGKRGHTAGQPRGGQGGLSVHQKAGRHTFRNAKPQLPGGLAGQCMHESHQI